MKQEDRRRKVQAVLEKYFEILYIFLLNCNRIMFQDALSHQTIFTFILTLSHISETSSKVKHKFSNKTLKYDYLRKDYTRIWSSNFAL